MGIGWWVALGAVGVWPVLAWMRRRQRRARGVPGYTEWHDEPGSEKGGCAIAVGAAEHHVVRYGPEGEEGSVVFEGALEAGVYRFELPEGAGSGSWRVEAPHNTVVRRVQRPG